jgi:hypothetical protein
MVRRGEAGVPRFQAPYRWTFFIDKLEDGRPPARSTPVFFLSLFASPAFADPLQGENGFCVLLGLTLIGVLAGWAVLFLVPPRGRMPADSGLVIVAAPALYLSVIVFLPSLERLVLVMPVMPLIVAGIVRAYFYMRTSP